MANEPVRIEYVEARRVLLDALGALEQPLGDRLAAPNRLKAKDAGDVYRLFDAIGADEMADAVRALLDDPRSAVTTAKALAYMSELFRAAASPGVVLASDALRSILPAETITAVLTAYANDVMSRLNARDR